MAKKMIKNILLSFVIIYSILNVTAFFIAKTKIYLDIKEITTMMLPENRTIEMYEKEEESAERIIDSMRSFFDETKKEEKIPATSLALENMYIRGKTQMLEVQLLMIISSVCISIVIGIIISLTERSKVREILYFVLIGLTINLIYTIYFHLTRNLPGLNFFEGFIENFVDNIYYYGIYYIAGYIILFLGRFYINKKKTTKLNEELKSKQK